MSEPDAMDELDLPPEVEGESISGVVTDFQGVPLVGVRVEVAETGGGDLDLLPVLTDGSGRFEVTGLVRDTRYDLRFKLGSVKARTLAVPVQTDQLQVKLARPQGIQLLVKTESGEPVPDVTYVVLCRRGPQGPIREYFGRTLRQRLLLWSIRPGLYTVTVWGGPYLPVEADGILVKEGESAPEVQVVLGARGASLEGVVRNIAGEPCDALVSWRRVDAAGHVPRHMTTVEARAGGFAFHGLPAGRYRISAYSEEHGIAEQEVDVAEEADGPPLTLSLR